MARIKRRQIEQGQSIDKPPSLLYQAVSTMREFGIKPHQWSLLGKVDKKVLHYFRVMENYYMDVEKQKAEQKSKLDDTKKNLPHVVKHKGRLK